MSWILNYSESSGKARASVTEQLAAACTRPWVNSSALQKSRSPEHRRARHTAQLVWRLTSVLERPGTHICTREAESGKLWIHRKFRSCLGYRVLLFNNSDNNNKSKRLSAKQWFSRKKSLT